MASIVWHLLYVDCKIPKTWITLKTQAFTTFVYQLKFPYYPTLKPNLQTKRESKKNDETKWNYLTIKICTQIVITTDTQLSIKTNLLILIINFFWCFNTPDSHIPGKKNVIKIKNLKFSGFQAKLPTHYENNHLKTHIH